ncbi:putative outer membrane surface antigen protein [Desulfamplus magnetovallimortis]|uniref:Putative outer membrane surface antigen protein n=1 Tax=Desulfamplus magnetovallimortis TaxID=1246637 RepID=A0A1W1H8P3_9BACT|nr:outer membrane protein assembly factor [Desulfamplus magnetovallimortis]SLM28860.1 putative outer membrane surface antigen protein [Desulfamplus magnetovallimortis]
MGYNKIICLVMMGFLLINGVCHAEEKEELATDKAATARKCIHIEEFNLHGNSAFSTARLKLRMKTWHSSLMPGSLNCFNEKWLQKDIKGLVELYRQKGYPDVDIIYSLNRSRDDSSSNMESEDENASQDSNGIQVSDSYVASDLDINIKINEGLKYELQFQGNIFFSEKDLEKQIDLVEKGNIQDSALKKGKVSIRQKYLDAGFQDVAVSFEKNRVILDDSGQEVWQVLYNVNEGVQSVVNALIVKGNQKIDIKDIMAAMLIRQKGMLEVGGFNEKVLQKDINAIELLYLSRGFLNARVEKKISFKKETSEESDIEIAESEVTTEKSESATAKSDVAITEKNVDIAEKNINDLQYVDIEISINEGIQTLVSSVRITGLESFDNSVLSVDELLSKISLKPDQPFREYMITSDENLLGMMVSEKGYPHVKVHGSSELNSDKSLADIVWKVEPGQFIRFGNIKYSGNTRLKEDVLEKRVAVVPGEPFSLKKVLLTEKQIRESSAVKYVQVKAPGLAMMENAPDLEVEIQEKMPYFLEAAIGYDTEQTFFLDTKVGDNNFLGREIDAWVAAKISGIGYRAETGLAKPYFWGSNINATGNLYVEDQEELNQDFGTKSWGAEAGFTRPLFTRKLTAGLTMKYENRNTYGDVEPEEQDARNIMITSLSLGYDSRDSSVRPTTGMLSAASMDVFTGFDSDLDRFLKYKVDFRKYITPFKHLVFALRTRLGYIQPFGTEDSVAEDQLFFLGGTSDVRGFKENMLEYDSSDDPAGGRTTASASLEARIELPAQFELNCFVDTGRIDDLESDVESRGFRSSVGLGLRYITPIGPVGILYGHKLDPDEGEDSGRIHLSVGYTF